MDNWMVLIKRKQGWYGGGLVANPDSFELKAADSNCGNRGGKKEDHQEYGNLKIVSIKKKKKHNLELF